MAMLSKEVAMGRPALSRSRRSCVWGLVATGLLALPAAVTAQTAGSQAAGQAAGGQAAAQPAGPTGDSSGPARPPVDTAPFAPFLGTWSGVFTTQDNEFWGLEDWVCFAGCPPEAREHMAALLDDPANDERPVRDLMGESWGFGAQALTALLTPEGLAVQQENTPTNDPKLHCQPYGFVREVTNPLPIVIQLDGDTLLFRYEEWSLLRTVYLDGRPHPEHQTPTLLGHAVGRIEDGALVIETARVTPGWISDFTQAGYSAELTGVERYTVHDNPRRLELELTIVDPVTLTGPHKLVKTWLATPDVELVHDMCSELPGKF